jgi:hypothetical protein
MGENKTRWIVSWAPMITGSDWDLLRHVRTEFDSEREALEFAKTKVHKGKQVYWQPEVWQEQEVVEVVERRFWKPIGPSEMIE